MTKLLDRTKHDALASVRPAGLRGGSARRP